MTPRRAVAVAVVAWSRGHVVRGRAGMAGYSALEKVIYAATPAKTTSARRGSQTRRQGAVVGMRRAPLGMRLDIKQRTLLVYLDGSHRVVMVAPGDGGHGRRTGG